MRATQARVDVTAVDPGRRRVHRLGRFAGFAGLCWLFGMASVQADGVVPLREKLDVLQSVYRDVIFSVTNNTIRLIDGRIVVVDDGRRKSHLGKVRDGDIEDMLAQIYPLGKCYKKRSRNQDPGRIRNETLLRALYGKNAYQVRQHLAPIDWFGTTVFVSKLHGAYAAAVNVRRDLERLDHKYHPVFKTPGETFRWRKVKNRDRLSVHAFAIALDMNAAFANDWRSRRSKPGKVRRYRNKVPNEVVEVFERHGFIWAGKWYHYDTQHFEYRPELIAIARIAEARGCDKSHRGQQPKPKQDR